MVIVPVHGSAAFGISMQQVTGACLWCVAAPPCVQCSHQHSDRHVIPLCAGAGNQLPVVALDILHMLLAEDHVVLVKMNPVNDYYGPLLRQVNIILLFCIEMVLVLGCQSSHQEFADVKAQVQQLWCS